MSIQTSAAVRPAAVAPRPSPPIDAGARLRRDWHARLKPIDEAERAAVDAIVATVICRLHLAPVEARVLDRLAAGSLEPGMPSLATLCRFRARLEKDRLMADQELAELQALRPREVPHPSLNPDRLEWLAEHLRRRRATPRPERQAEPARPADTAPARPAADGLASTAPAAAASAAPAAAASAAPASAASGPPAGAGTAPAAAAPEPPHRRPRATGPLMPPAPPPRVDWLASTSTYAIAAAQLASGRT